MLHCLGYLAAALKAKDTHSPRMNDHSTYYCLKTILILCCVDHSAVLPIAQYMNTGAAEPNTISNKSQPTKRQVKQISLQCSIYFESGTKDVFQILKAHIYKPKHMQKQSQSRALTSIRLVEAHNVLRVTGDNNSITSSARSWGHHITDDGPRSSYSRRELCSKVITWIKVNVTLTNGIRSSTQKVRIHQLAILQNYAG